MAEVNAGLVVVYFTAGLVALALATVLLRPIWLPVWRLFRGTQQFLEDWFGEPERKKDGVAARPGAMARLAQLERNSGSSLRDAIDRIEGQIESVKQDVADVQCTAEQATTAAGIAVGEAKAGRAVMAEAAENTRGQIAELRGAVGALASTVNESDRHALAQEIAFVRALRRLGVDLTDVTDELPDEQL